MRVFSAKSLALAALMAATIGAPQLIAQSAQGRDEDLEGELEVQIEDGPTASRLHHFLDTGSEKIRLRGKPDGSDFQGLTSGSRVRVRGRRSDASTLELGNNGGNVTTLSLASPNTFGEQRVAVILVNFQDLATQPYTWSDAANVTFSQTSDFFRENSYGQTWLTGDVFGWFTIAMNSTVCDVNTLASLADQAASRAGANLSSYTRRVYGFPRNACTWWGLGTVGGNPSRAWIKGTYSLKVVGHELGHNFGDYHSNSMPCDTGGCAATAYGDDRDIMGLSGTGHFHAYQKERFGWLNYGSSPAIQTVTSSGNYWISSFESGSSPSALKILKSSTSSDRTYYYIETRSAVGFDAPYPGVVVHTGNSANGDSAYQIDLDPLTSTFDAVLDPGQTFSDAAAGMTITTISADGSGAWIQVSYAGQPCTKATPSVSLSPASSVTSPLVTSAYTLTVRNNDDAACSSASFDLGMAVPSGWVWSAAQPAIAVAPGSTAGTTLYVTPPDGANGPNNLTAMAARADGSGPSGSTAVTLTVASSLEMTLRTTGGNQYQASATLSAGGNPVAGVVVTFKITDPRGAVSTVSGTTNAFGTATIKGRLKGKDPRGTYHVLASATSGNLSGSAAGSFVY